MKLKEYQKLINKLVKDGHGEKDVYYASDDEGNSYKKVFYAPSVYRPGELPDEVVIIN